MSTFDHRRTPQKINDTPCKNANIRKRHISTHHRPHLPHFTTHYRNCVCTARNAVFLDSLSSANIVAKRFVFAPQQWRFSQLDDVICRLTRPQRQRAHTFIRRPSALAGWLVGRLPASRLLGALGHCPLHTKVPGPARSRPPRAAPEPRAVPPGPARPKADGLARRSKERGCSLRGIPQPPLRPRVGGLRRAGLAQAHPSRQTLLSRAAGRRVRRSRKPDRVCVERLPAAHACRRGLQPAACLALARHPARRDAMLHAAARGCMEEAARRHEHTRVCSWGWGKLRPTHWSHAGATWRSHITQSGAMRCSMLLRGAACRKLRAARCPVLQQGGADMTLPASWWARRAHALHVKWD